MSQKKSITLPDLKFIDPVQVDMKRESAVASFLKKYRKTHNLSQTALAKKLEVTVDAIFLIEAKNFRLTNTHIAKFERLLGTQILS